MPARAARPASDAELDGIGADLQTWFGIEPDLYRQFWKRSVVAALESDRTGDSQPIAELLARFFNTLDEAGIDRLGRASAERHNAMPAPGPSEAAFVARIQQAGKALRPRRAAFATVTADNEFARRFLSAFVRVRDANQTDFYTSVDRKDRAKLLAEPQLLPFLTALEDRKLQNRVLEAIAFEKDGEYHVELTKPNGAAARLPLGLDRDKLADAFRAMLRDPRWASGAFRLATAAHRDGIPVDILRPAGTVDIPSMPPLPPSVMAHDDTPTAPFTTRFLRQQNNKMAVPGGFEPYQIETKPLPPDPRTDDELSNPAYFDPLELRAAGITDVEGFVRNLPEVFRRRFVMLQKSASNHLANEKHPRVMMFDYDHAGRSLENHSMDIIAFGTHPDDKARTIVERIHWNPKALRFEYSAIDFSSGVPTALPNTDCVKCHTPYLRPNWDPGHNWPAAVGTREKYDLFNPNESRLAHTMFENNPILQRNFREEDQHRFGEQTPATVMFYGLYGPTQHFVSNRFFQNERYPKNKIPLLKVLAGCQSEIAYLKGRFPTFFAAKEKEVREVAPKFKFADNNSPVLDSDFLNAFSALLALMQTPTDDLSWFGKTAKVPQMYTHTFYREDFDQLIGGLCNRDPHVTQILLQNGADAADPCNKRGDFTRRICAVPDPADALTRENTAPGQQPAAQGAQSPALLAARERVAGLLRDQCLRCHDDATAKGEFVLAANAAALTPQVVASLKTAKIGKGTAMDRIVARAGDAKDPMPPDAYSAKLAFQLAEWARLESGK